MAVVNAHVGEFQYYSTQTDATNSNIVRVNTAFWRGDWGCEYTPVTIAGNGDGMTLLPVIGVASWSVSFPLDDANDPSVLGLEEGDVIYQAFFKRGNQRSSTLAVYDQVDQTTLVSIQIVNNNLGDAVRVTLTGMGGRVTEGVAR
jgi:hypothetical protein